ncbi:hypothetical protein [Mesorhizobium sp.]|uniref:hypothetical protein n=1 Tax=Mesorhizobium sp. TaxID=1871066 RepID=UPI00257C596E|nr:hypothetical protein [Mesorhizobium sp.]
MSDQSALVDISTGAAPIAAPISTPAPVETFVDDSIDIGKAYDRAMTQNGADRADDGKFTSTNPPAETPVAEAAPIETPSAPATAAPAHLPQAIKADWDKIPETARGAIVAHQAEMDRKFGEIGKQYQAVKPIADKLTHATTAFPEFAGMTPDQLAQGALELAAVQSNLNKDPVGTIIEIARTYNCLPRLQAAMAGKEAPAGDQGQLITGLQQKIANLESQISKAANPDTIREQISMTMSERETQTEVQTYAKGKEHWGDVEASLPHFIRMVMENQPGKSKPEILDAAYDMAINANPTVRAKVRAAEAQATVTALDPARADKARKAASINVKSTSNGAERAMTEEEAFGAAYDRAMAN